MMVHELQESNKNKTFRVHPRPRFPVGENDKTKDQIMVTMPISALVNLNHSEESDKLDNLNH